MQQQEDSFIGTRLKLLPPSLLLFATPTQLLLHNKRQITRLDLPSQTLASCKIEDQKILHAAFHPQLEVYFLLTQYQLLCINIHGQLINRLAIEPLQGCKFLFLALMADGYQGIPNQRRDLCLYVKGDHFYMAKIVVYFERQLINNKGICSIDLVFQTSSVLESPEFIDRAKMFNDERLLVLWNTDETYIYKLPANSEEHLERMYIYNKISKRDNLSLDYAVSLPQRLLAVGMQSGAIKLFHLDISRKYLLDLRGHQVACSSLLVPKQSPWLLYSSSGDGAVRIWSLVDYEQVYILQLDLLVRSVELVSQSLLFARTDQLKSKSYLCEINANLLQPLVNDNTSGHLLRMRCDKDWSISIFSNNLVQFFMPTQQGVHHKFQFPLQYGTLANVFKLAQDTYAITLQRGFSLVRFDKRQVRGDNFDLKKLVYQSTLRKNQDEHFIELIHEKLLDTYLFQVLSDWKDIPAAISPSSLAFTTHSCLPRWYLSTSQLPLLSVPVDYCIIGSTKGEIFFVDISQRTHFTTKVHFHSKPITLIREVSRQENCVYFISVSADRQLSLWNLSEKECPRVLSSVNYSIDVTFLEVFGNFLVVGQKQGDFSVIRVSFHRGEPILQMSSSKEGHLRAVICGDHMFYKDSHLFLSGGEDSTIKIWRGVEKELLFQLRLFGIISTINFIHQNMDLIVCHNQQISLIPQQKLKALRRADQLLNIPSKPLPLQPVSLSRFFLKEVASPISPYRQGRLLRMTSRYSTALKKSSSAFEDAEGRKAQGIHSFRRSPLKGPLSVPKLEEIDKKYKIKRFHAFSIEELNSQLNLPRIRPQKTGNRNPTPRVRRDREIIEELKQARNKSLSLAGKKRNDS